MISTSGSGTVSKNELDMYQKTGVLVNELGTNVVVSGNTILGIDRTPAIAQNGVQVAFGATADVVSNSISKHIYTGSAGDRDDSGGVLLFQPDNDTRVNRAVSRV